MCPHPAPFARWLAAPLADHPDDVAGAAAADRLRRPLGRLDAAT